MKLYNILRNISNNGYRKIVTINNQTVTIHVPRGACGIVHIIGSGATIADVQARNAIYSLFTVTNGNVICTPIAEQTPGLYTVTGSSETLTINSPVTNNIAIAFFGQGAGGFRAVSITNN